MTWVAYSRGVWYLAEKPLRYPSLARVIPRGELGWALEMWRPGVVCSFDWEFIRHFDDPEEAKRVGFTLARLEN